MRPILPCLFCAALASAAHAQSPCPNPDLSSHPGAWKPRAGYVGPARFKAPPGSYNRAAADATLNKLLALLQAAYPEPRGGMAYYEKSFTFSSPDRELPSGYSLYAGHSSFYCTMANRLVEGGETGVTINVDVNTFLTTAMLSIVTAPQFSTSAGSARFNADEDGNYLIGGRIAYRAPAVAAVSADAVRYSRTSRANRGGAPTEQFIVLRKSETPLFTHVTRREYLQQFRDELATYKSSEMERARTDATTPGAVNPEWLARFVKAMDAYINAVNTYLRSAPETELSRPVSGLLPHLPFDLDNPQVRFEDGDYHLVHFNPAYLDKKVPLHIPQFIVIQWTIKDTTKPAAWEANFREHIANRLDLAAIRSLLTAPGR